MSCEVESLYLIKFGRSLWKLSLDPADVLLEHLAVPDLLFHVSGLAGVAAEHEQARRQPVQREDFEDQ